MGDGGRNYELQITNYEFPVSNLKPSAKGMKVLLRVCVCLVLAALPAAAEDATNRFIGVWKVDWDQAPVIESVPEMFVWRYKTVDEFRGYVASRAKGLVLSIRTNNVAVLRYSDGTTEEYLWMNLEQPNAHDIWMQHYRGFTAASVGHGFKVTDTNTATFKFQLEWDENTATRVPLIMQRQPPGSEPAAVTNAVPKPTFRRKALGALAELAAELVRRRSKGAP